MLKHTQYCSKKRDKNNIETRVVKYCTILFETFVMRDDPHG